MSSIRKTKYIVSIALLALVALGGSQALARGGHSMGSPTLPATHPMGRHTYPGAHTTTHPQSNSRMIQQDEPNFRPDEQMRQNYQRQQQLYRDQDRQNMTPKY
ncbi:hypothetical protein M2281_003887 [Mesorhizobium soli]|nr:hypothetical protein [Mesorhizobium soli]